jgi:hypothetical protein
MRYRIALNAVRAALKDDELRVEFLQMRHYPRPHLRESGIVGPWGHRQIELRRDITTFPS